MVDRLFLAKPRGFCAGVVMAIQAVEDAAREMRDQDRGDLLVYHSIVHNDTVVERLERNETTSTWTPASHPRAGRTRSPRT